MMIRESKWEWIVNIQMNVQPQYIENFFRPGVLVKWQNSCLKIQLLEKVLNDIR